MVLSTSAIFASNIEDLEKDETIEETSFVDESIPTIQTFTINPVTYTEYTTRWHVNPKSNASNYKNYYNFMLISYNGYPAYCIDPMSKLKKTYAIYNDTGYENSSYMTKEQKDTISKIVKYGYGYPGHDTLLYYQAAQKMIWETLGYNIIYYSDTAYKVVFNISSYENEIRRLISLDDTIPSFSGQTIQLDINKPITIVDSNNSLKDFNISDVDGINITRNDNSLTIEATKKTEGTIYFNTGKKNNTYNSSSLSILVSNESQNLLVYPDGSFPFKKASLNFNVNTYGDLLLVKQDGWTKERLPGVTFSISSKNDMSDATTYTTDANGEISLKYIPTGTYYYQEISTSPNHILDSKIKTIEIHDGEVSSVFIDNEPIKSSLTLQKTIEGDTIDAVLNGKDFIFTFKRLNKKQQDIIVTTDDNGIATTSLPYGEYEISEQHVASFEIKKPWTITINEKSTIVNVHNAKSRRDVVVYKLDSASGKAIVNSKANFEVIHDNQKIVNPSTNTTTFQTDENGSFIIPQLLSGTYYLNEIEAPSGYYQSNNLMEFIVEDGSDIMTVGFLNDPKLGKITVNKVGEIITGFKEENTEFGNLHSYVFSTTVLKDVIFELRAKEDIITNDSTKHYSQGEVVYSGATDNNGVFVVDNLPIGVYELEEISTLEQYNLDKTIHTIEISTNDLKPTVSITNHLKRKSVTIKKNFEHSLFISKEQAIKNTVFGLYTKSIIDEHNIEKDQLLDIIKLDSDGNISFELLVEHDYYIKEIQTHDSYILADNMDIIYHNGLIKSKLHDINNVLYRNDFKVQKNSLKYDRALKDATFGLYTYDNPSVPIEEKASNENGNIVFENLEVGTYFIKELKAPKGYALDSSPHKITVTKDDNLNKVTITNDFVVDTGVDENSKMPVYLGSGALLAAIMFTIYKKRK